MAADLTPKVPPPAVAPAAGAAAAADRLLTVPVIGTDLAVTDYASTMDWMDQAIARGERVCLTAAAVHLVMVAEEDTETRSAVAGALAVPDGQPLVWAMRALGHSQASRVYGPEL